MSRSKLFKIGLLITFIPIIMGAIYYNRLPESMPIHFGSDNLADDYASKNFALFGIPLFMMILYVATYFITDKDPRRKYQGEGAMRIVLLIIPVLSVAISYLSISYSLGNRIDISTWARGFIYVLFILMGNYFPKTKRNYTVGIKLPWTLHSDYVWDKTHRFGGYVWIGGGIFGIASMFLNKFEDIIMIAIILVITFLPMIYSYIVYKEILNE
ncbi:SdpI family protein [Peptoniphilus mikwangii]|uniref:SdpI family protein n=1 Tax=Peptoniphilus mikwangii TaxID=1354300 RepID=UPI000408C99D|nr:SdpI family protein [Peptoniphilus mikwangii]